MILKTKVFGNVFNPETQILGEGFKEITLDCTELDRFTKGSFPFELFQLYNFEENKITSENELQAKPETLHRLTMLYVDKFVKFADETEKKEFMVDCFAKITLGNQLFREVFTPFFISAMPYFR